MFNVYVQNHQGPARTVTVKSRAGALRVVVSDRHHHRLGSSRAFKVNRNIEVFVAAETLQLPGTAELRWSVTLIDMYHIHSFRIPGLADRFPDQGLLTFQD